MNDDRTPETGEFESLEHQMKSVRPVEVPSLVHARLQFELGRLQGRREARKAMFAYASAACLAVWAGTTWLERSKTEISTDTIVRNMQSEPASNAATQPAGPAWSMEEVQKLVRYEAGIRGDARLGGQARDIEISPNETAPKDTDKPTSPWDRRRWLKELNVDAAMISG